jgi:hypothetical protein
MYIYIYKDGSPSIESTRHVKTNVDTQEESQNNQNNRNEIENLTLKGHLLPQINW